MKIAGFTFGKKHLIILGVLILAIFVISRCSAASEERRHQEQMKEFETQQKPTQNQPIKNETTFTDDELALLENYSSEQQNFIKLWGFPPEGYEWNKRGELVAISSDEMTAEDVIYGYLRNLSMLDFSTAGRYVQRSTVIDNYKLYYEGSVAGKVDSYTEYIRKLYKLSIKNIEIVGVGDISIFEDGTQYVTVHLKCLDMSDKDFWLADKDTLFVNMYKASVDEEDSNKMLAYIYDYIYSKYSESDVPKKTYEIELVLTKGINKGWLITNDVSLYNILIDPKGTGVHELILSEYQEYIKSLR